MYSFITQAIYYKLDSIFVSVYVRTFSNV